MKDYTVSILVPVYGVERFIERCARSLFEQSYDSIEYIFVNDCTKDKSIEILRRIIEEYPARKQDIFIVEHPQNKGLAAARNTALAHAHGMYTMHVDSDDFLETDAVQLMVEKALSEQADIVVGDINLVIAEKKQLLKREIQEEKTAYLCQLLDWGTVELSVAAKLIRRSVYQESGVQFVDHVCFGEDFSVTPRLVYHAHGIVFLRRPVYNYEKSNETSYSSQRLSERHATSLVEAAKIVYPFFEAKPEASLYETAIARGQAKIKCFILRAVAPQSRKKYKGLFPGLCRSEKLGYSPKIKLFLTQNGLLLLLRIYERGERFFTKKS